ncbi:hypothetical protein MMC11_004603 [Xylographa trunciseda]|nr:hypothetical protein [Xylographa trunciseda]
MRFVNTTSLTFHEVSDSELHQMNNGYSILSHRWTWGDDEIMYMDVLSMNPDIKSKDGYAKFAGACTLAKQLGYDFLWIDTCCINKTDSVEIGEAINSMYRWYSMAKVCIAYLQDVTSSAQIDDSEWFKRGWTLQELIAPETVCFYDRSWNRLGDKASLSSVLVNRTGIPADVLKNTKPPQAYSIAQRMSWAAKRTTKRLEDRAYSLMGLFDVNMPMIYGERERAFIRLQEQIISKSADESIFVWDLEILEDSTRDARHVHCGLLATSPACFAKCGDIISNHRSRGFRINQFGLSISLGAIPYPLDAYMALLNAFEANTSAPYVILLAKLPEGNSFARISFPSGASIMTNKTPTANWMEFSVSLEPFESPLYLYPGFWLRKLDFRNSHITAYKILERRYSGEDDRLMLPDGEFGTAGIISLSFWDNKKRARFGWIKLGFDKYGHPICFVTIPGPRNPATKLMPVEAEKLLAITRGSSGRIEHPIFNDDWTFSWNRKVSEEPSHGYDSRDHTGYFVECHSLDHACDPYHGFDFTFNAPVFDIAVSARRIPDISPTSGRRGEVWAVDLVAGTTPEYHNSSCCW